MGARAADLEGPEIVRRHRSADPLRRWRRDQRNARAGYDVAVIEMRVDDAGLGTGSMAAAAKVKPGGETGVVIDYYAAQPISLTKVVRKLH